MIKTITLIIIKSYFINFIISKLINIILTLFLNNPILNKAFKNALIIKTLYKNWIS